MRAFALLLIAIGAPAIAQPKIPECSSTVGEDLIICSAIQVHDKLQCAPIIDPDMNAFCEALASNDMKACDKIKNGVLRDRECRRRVSEAHE